MSKIVSKRLTAVMSKKSSKLLGKIVTQISNTKPITLQLEEINSINDHLLSCCMPKIGKIGRIGLLNH